MNFFYYMSLLQNWFLLKQLVFIFKGPKLKLKLKILLNGFLVWIHMNEKEQITMITMVLNGKKK
jgi:hypothetical protein